MDLTNEIKLAQKLAQEAAKMARSMQPGIKAWNKPNNQGPVSSADIAIDKFLVDQIQKDFPKDLIISEESYNNFPKNNLQRTWFIDPIDGTKSYIAGNDDYVVMIGLVINNKPVLGVIAQAVQEKIFVGVMAEPPQLNRAWVINKQETKILKLLDQDYRLDQLRVVGSLYSRSKKNSHLLKFFATKNFIPKSSVGYKATMIAENSADLYIAWSHRLHLWDTCAPAALIQAAGGYILTTDGQQLDFSHNITHEKPVIISNFDISKSLLNQIQKIAKIS